MKFFPLLFIAIVGASTIQPPLPDYEYIFDGRIWISEKDLQETYTYSFQWAQYRNHLTSTLINGDNRQSVSVTPVSVRFLNEAHKVDSVKKVDIAYGKGAYTLYYFSGKNKFEYYRDQVFKGDVGKWFVDGKLVHEFTQYRILQ